VRGPYARISHVHPHLTGAPGVGSLTAAEQAMTKAMQEKHANALVALADCLTALQAASLELERDPRNATAVRDYNFGIARIFQIVHEAKLDPWSAPVTIPSQAGGFVLKHKSDPRPEWNPALYEFTPADEFDVGGKYVTERTTRFWHRSADRRRRTRAEKPKGGLWAFPSLLQRNRRSAFEGRRCVLSFEDPLAAETVAFNGRTVLLAAHFTVPLAMMLQETDPKKHEFSRLLNPEKYAHTAASERLQPYDPSKTVVLVIHGLRDSQATWTPMINKLRGDPVIRKHYQFWFYSYPTGYPFPYSVAILRDELDAVEKRFRKIKPMVVVGHSMGGCISRLLLTDSGNKLWMNIFGRPPDEVPLSPRCGNIFGRNFSFDTGQKLDASSSSPRRCAAATWQED